MNALRVGRISLNCIHVKEYSKTAVKSGNDFLYNKVRLSVRAVFNPATQIDSLSDQVTWRPGDGVAGLAVPNQPVIRGPLTTAYVQPSGTTAGLLNRPAAYTTESLRWMLMQPRQQTVWTIDGVQVLVSPLPGYRTDSTNGPWPVSCQVVELHGSKTWQVDYTVDTDISDCAQFVSRPEPILSTTWQMSHRVDQDHYTTRLIEGKTILDAQVVRGLNNDPGTENPSLADRLRQDFLFPVPKHMKRVAVNVRLLEDGCTVVWSVEDKEMPFTYVYSLYPYVTRIEAQHMVENGKADMLAAGVGGWKATAGKGDSGLASFVGGVLGWLGNAAAAVPHIFGSRGDRPSWGFSSDWFTSLRHYFATSTHTFVVRVWGNKNAPRAGLEEVARRIIKDRRRAFSSNVVRAVPAATRVVHDVMGTFVEGQDVYIGGPLRPDNIGDPLPTSRAANASYFNTADDITDSNGSPILLRDVPAGQVPNKWPDLPSDGGTRGTYIELLLGQYLSSPCHKRPTLPSVAVPPVQLIVPTPSTPPDWLRPGRDLPPTAP